MITRALAAVSSVFAPKPARLPPGRRVYAVGDVHGRLEKLVALHAAVRQDLAARPAQDALLVHLGDLIDRGPDSAGVVAHVLAGPPVPGLPVVNLMGNHERMMLDAVLGTDAEAVDLWLSNGGVESLASWRIPVRSPARHWAGLLPPGHLAFLQGLALHWTCEAYLFVHAGVKPGVPLAEQEPLDLLWIRGPFLNWQGPMLPVPEGATLPGTVVVHGHTPSPAPEVRPNRIGIDTGAGRGGPLTCAVLEGSEVRFLQA